MVLSSALCTRKLGFSILFKMRYYSHHLHVNSRNSTLIELLPKSTIFGDISGCHQGESAAILCFIFSQVRPTNAHQTEIVLECFECTPIEQESDRTCILGTVMR